MVDPARRQHCRIHLFGRPATVAKHLRRQARLEHLSSGQTGNDDRYSELFGTIEAQRVDRLEAPLTDVAEARQAVAKDGVHRGRRRDLERHTQRLGHPPHVLLGTVRDKAVVQGEGVDRQAHVDQLAQRIRTVLATTEKE